MLHACLLLLRRRGAGIIGLPNVGKSTLFNALTCSQQAKTGNFPFCTINANLARVPVVDDRLRRLAAFAGAQRIVDVEIDLADVAGLIEGASKGAGLGNKFLADIRPCTILLHMVRCFESAKDGFDAPTPLDDISIIVNELVLADLEAMEKLLHKNRKTRRAGDAALEFCQRVVSWLQDGMPVSYMKLKTEEERQWLQQYQLLSAKPMLFVLNMDEASVVTGNKFAAEVEEKFGTERTCRVSASLEEQTSQLASRDERLMFLQEYGIDLPRGEVLLRNAYRLLRLQSFFTVGPLMAHGWTTKVGATAKEASGEIHSDMEKYFRRARVMPYSEFLSKPNLEAAEMQMAFVDAKHIMKDGDVMIVEHNTPI
ncbi:putative GTP-binding protein [Trypanosoma cruzi]|uniref:GTP-binding protein, putative n=3 Tax=Trypanosoma cruzi TaxID=5693 RepID=Q4DNY5_TRYCC|nr:GTP-binding protein, putative [Trypanosoma cruzi]EAN94221.1 GTP-binding protein, putative [Trypanosoma cruzi]KAF8298036.1 putative GTP-binding protein [Trypanosoma cruzi]PWV05174.1 putative GTP-binding protein [Trypanosoma cruzi]RNC55978.1 putative GTP-binding protein [Trypanosoma cruzi]|eukprot:XP_816072.1 GTP-binding protein [Trypanosoma cruzi strain CL Brener]